MFTRAYVEFTLWGLIRAYLGFTRVYVVFYMCRVDIGLIGASVGFTRVYVECYMYRVCYRAYLGFTGAYVVFIL